MSSIVLWEAVEREREGKLISLWKECLELRARLLAQRLSARRARAVALRCGVLGLGLVTAGSSAAAGGANTGSSVASAASGAKCGVFSPLKLPLIRKEPSRGFVSEGVLANFNDYANPVPKDAFASSSPRQEAMGGRIQRVVLRERMAPSGRRGDEEGSDAAQKAGLVKKYLFDNSNNNNATQIQQIQSMIEQGANIIYTIAGWSTALNGVIKDAYSKGIPVVTIASAVTSPYAINLDVTYALHSILMALGVINAIGKKGNVVTVQGLSGAPGSITYENAEKPIFAACPNINIIANIYGQWSQSVAKTQMLTTLATHPEQINGIWTQGSMDQGIIQALEQTGRSTSVAMSDDGPEAQMLAYWASHEKQGFKGISTVQPPAADAYAAFQIGMRVMAGKGLRVNTVVGGEPILTNSNFQLSEAGWTFNTTASPEPPPGSFLENSYLDNFFTDKGSVNYGEGASP